MIYTLEEKYSLITKEILTTNSINPIEIMRLIAHKEFISIHGPEHHFLDGASFLVAYKNAGGNIDINEALKELANRTSKMPGAMCGYWGVCGSVTSIGACLSIINKTGPLTVNDFYKDNMEFTSQVITYMSKIGGPRCCKRNAFISLICGVNFIKEKYGVIMEASNITCEFSHLNQQCIGNKCPYHK